MIYQYEKILHAIFKMPFAEIRKAWIARARFERDQTKSILAHYEEHGFERVDVPDGSLLTPDGREVLNVAGVPLALLPMVHAERKAKALATVVSTSAPNKQVEQVPDESLAATICPQIVNGKPCSGSLNVKGVCPSCITGRMGYRYRYTCESCGFDIVTKTRLKE